MVNGVQGPHKCSRGYCVWTRKSDNKDVCKKKFPFDYQLKTNIVFEPHGRNACGDIYYRSVIKTRRNDSLINPFIPVMLDHWRANLDFQIVIDAVACAEYIANTLPKLKKLQSV